jgi:hypothetical protein
VPTREHQTLARTDREQRLIAGHVDLPSADPSNTISTDEDRAYAHEAIDRKHLHPNE